MLLSFSYWTWHLPPCFNNNCFTAFDWLANWPDLNLKVVVKRKRRDTRPHNSGELRGTPKATVEGFPLQMCYTLAMFC